MSIRAALAAATLICFAAPAVAADYWAEKPFELRAGKHDWTGGYAGLHGGWGWGRHSGTFFAEGISRYDLFYSFNHTGRTKSDGFVGGVQSGYGVQLDTLYFGLEADLSYANIDGSRTWPFSVRDDTGTRHDTGLSITAKTDWLATLRGRVGVPVDNVLVYGTAGLAVGGVRMSALQDSSQQMRVGWTAGGGAEFALDGAWTMRGEYLYYDLGKKGYSLHGRPGSPAGGVMDIFGEADFSGHIVRAGLNYRFD